MVFVHFFDLLLSYFLSPFLRCMPVVFFPPEHDANSRRDGDVNVGGTSSSRNSAGVLLEHVMDLLDRPLYTMSGPDLEELLQLIEVLVAPLENLKEEVKVSSYTVEMNIIS